MQRILLATATIIETKAVLPVFEAAIGHPKSSERIDGKTYYRLGTLEHADLILVESEAGSATPDGSLDTLKDALRVVQPSAVIMVGIAFGMKRDRQKMCDILVSQYMRAYEPARIGQQLTPRGVYVNASSSLMDLVRSVQVDWKEPKVHTGLLLSGEKLVDDPGFLKELQTREPDALGGEMEGQGLYTAAVKAKVDWIIVKGISDWGNGRKSVKYQPEAAGNAARFVLEMVRYFTPSTGRYQVLPVKNGPANATGKPVSLANVQQVQAIVSRMIDVFSTHPRVFRDECKNALKQIDEIDAFLNYHWLTSLDGYTVLKDIGYIHALINSTRQSLQSLRETCPPGDPALRRVISANLKEIQKEILEALKKPPDQ